MEKLILIAFFATVAIMIAQMIRFGGVTGMFVGARPREKLGKIRGTAVGHRRVDLDVSRLDGQHPVAIHFTGHAFMNVERMAASLSEADAQRLAEALETAAREAEET